MDVVENDYSHFLPEVAMKAQAIGWDLHRKFSKVTVGEMSEDGQMRVIERARLEHDDVSAMERWIRRFPRGMPVAMEAAFGWPWVADLLEKCGLAPHLGHPPAIKELAKHEAKADRCDADRLAKFELRDILPESYLAPPEVRQVRERTRYRMAMVKIRSGIKNRIAAVLHRHGILHGHSDLFGRGGRAFLEKLNLPESSQAALEGYVRLMDEVTERITEVEVWMAENLPEDCTVRLLKTIPGIGLILANVITAEIGQINRFPDARHLCSYGGLAPLSDDSADRHGQRHCSRACNHALRWALIEAAAGVLHAKKEGHRLRRLYDRLTHGGQFQKNQARVAVAHELGKLVYIVWKKQQPYLERSPSRPGTTARLAKTASSQKRPEKKPTVHKAKRSVSSGSSDQPRVPMVRRQRESAGQTG